MAVSIKTFFRRLFRYLGYEVTAASASTSEYFILSRLFSDLGTDLVLDVGGNVGQFGRLVTANPKSPKVISFEPLPRCPSAPDPGGVKLFKVDCRTALCRWRCRRHNPD